jgi:hypothetical protein
MKPSLTLLALLVPLLSGCLATLDGTMENRLACTVAGDKLFVVSEYGPIGISNKIADADRAVVCKPAAK